MLELCQFLLKRAHQQVGSRGQARPGQATLPVHLSAAFCSQKLCLDLEALQEALQSLPNAIAFSRTGKMEDTYWAVMKHFGVT